MMTPAMLERASWPYRKGYNDALNRRPFRPHDASNNAGYHAKPFAEGDYRDGYRARMIERKWTARRGY